MIKRYNIIIGKAMKSFRKKFFTSDIYVFWGVDMHVQNSISTLKFRGRNFIPFSKPAGQGNIINDKYEL